MGRGKIEIKRIENSTNRQVTYAKRRKRIIKKASEITILCDAKVSIIICSSNGKINEHYCSPSTTLSSILEEYQKLSGRKLWAEKHENLNNEIDATKKENEHMEIKLKHMRGEDIQSLNHRDLMVLENTLENGLTNVRAAKTEYMEHLRQTNSAQGKILEAENKRLNYELWNSEMEVQGGSLEKMRDYNSQLSYAFHVQPMQPNLQGFRMSST